MIQTVIGDFFDEMVVDDRVDFTDYIIKESECMYCGNKLIEFHSGKDICRECQDRLDLLKEKELIKSRLLSLRLKK